MRRLAARVLATLAWGGLATPAMARPPEALACAIMAAPAGLDARLADAVLVNDPAAPEVQPALAELRAVTDRCAADQFLKREEREAYFSYALGRMARDVLDTRLSAVGVRSLVLDEALDIGPGRANNPAEKVTQGDLRRVAEALTAAGTDPESMGAEGWKLVTAWIVATAAMFDGLRALD